MLACAVLVGADATLVEPYRIELTRHTVRAPIRERLVIAHLSDLHTHGFGSREQEVVALLDRERPDLIVVTGDVVDGGDLGPARELFAKLHARLGVWVVRGNWENWKPPANDVSTIASYGATLLVNEGRLVRPDVWLAGVDDPMSGAADLAAALRGAPKDAARVALFHSPEAFDRFAPAIDLAFAGHTHGGQVRLPLFGAVWLPPGSGRYVAGWYSAESTQLFVSRGVGTSILDVRFLCRPEVAIVTVEPRP